MDRFQTIRRLVRHGTLPQLAAFEAIVRLGSFTRAAERLHMAQPTISGHMRKLTEAAGQPLLVIEGRHVLPTPAGQALLAATQEIFSALERAEGVLRSGSAESGTPFGGEVAQERAPAPCRVQILDPRPARSTQAG